ncbi:MAG: flagellar M-ring protein FliF [Lachnospira sp.]
MLEGLKQVPARLLEIWNKWTKTQKTVIVSAVAVFIIAVVIIVIVLSRTQYELLTTCEDYSELKQVDEILAGTSYKYEIDDLKVYVDKNNVTEAKMALADQNIKSSGYTFADAMNSNFSTTETDRNRMYAHYLESKFASDLVNMDGVKSATVTVKLADTSLSFSSTKAETSVGVTLITNKTISDDMAESMANFLATSVGNSTTNSITIIDNKGNTLFNGPSANNSTSGVSMSGKLKYKSIIESTVKDSIRSSIIATGMYDDVVISLNYNLNWDTVNTIATEYKAQEGREEGLFDTSYRVSSEGSDGAGGTPGTSSNGESGITYDIDTGNTSTSKYTVEQLSYLPDKIVTSTTSDPGGVVLDGSSIAVTFVKTVVYNEDDAKALGYLDDMTWEEFKSNNAEPVALDVDDQWYQIISMGSGIATGNIAVVAYQNNLFEDSASQSILSRASFWIQVVLAVAILGILVFVLLRSARPLTVEEKEPELSVEEMLATTKENQPTVEEIDLQEKSETRKAIEKFVDENPEAVALLLRNWLNDDWN